MKKLSTLIPNIPTTITRSVGRKVLIAKKQSPHVFFAAGIVGVVTGTVLACRATLSLAPKLENMSGAIEQLKVGVIDEDGNTYTQSDYRKDLTTVYFRGGLDIVRLYAPAVAVTTLSIAALTGSHIQMTRRNTALTATVASLSKAYEDYRDRVRAEVGVERELDLYHNARTETMLDADGKEISYKVVDPNSLSPYARFFDESCSDWVRNADTNRMFVQCQQSYYNDLLHARGHVFLNEVYDALGIKRTKAGQMVGWVLSDEGDNYIDFGLFDAMSSRFVNGLEQSILLDFNVDGVIYDKI